MASTIPVTVRIVFGQTIVDSRMEQVKIELAADGSDTVAQVKDRIAVAKGGKLTAEHIHLSFGPSDKYIGKQFQGDPNVDEAKLTLAPFSIITWLKQFPQWSITARLMPAAPPPPGVAIRKAAALAEGKDPDKAVTEARAKGELLKESQLPPPWGPKAYKPDQQTLSSYQPQQYPASITAA